MRRPRLPARSSPKLDRSDADGPASARRPADRPSPVARRLGAGATAWSSAFAARGSPRVSARPSRLAAACCRTAPGGGRRGRSRAGRRWPASAAHAPGPRTRSPCRCRRRSGGSAARAPWARSARGRRRNRAGPGCPSPPAAAPCGRRWRSRCGSSSAAARRYSSSTSGWSSASDSTRAMTRRCPVIFRPRSTHKRSMRDSIVFPGHDSPTGVADPEAGLSNPARRARRQAATRAAGAEADLLGQGGPMLGVVRRHHRVVGAQAPALAILVRRHVVGAHQVALQHLQLLAVLQADDVVREDGFLDRHRRLRPLRRRARAAPEARHGPVHVADQLRQSVRRHRVGFDVGRNDLGGQRQRCPSAAASSAIINHSMNVKPRYIRGAMSISNSDAWSRRLAHGCISMTDLDITSEVCPMTFVRTRLALDRLALRRRAAVTLRGEEPRRNVPQDRGRAGPHRPVGRRRRTDGTTVVSIRRA